jgi:hypothetical protein
MSESRELLHLNQFTSSVYLTYTHATEHPSVATCFACVRSALSSYALPDCNMIRTTQQMLKHFSDPHGILLPAKLVAFLQGLPPQCHEIHHPVNVGDPVIKSTSKNEQPRCSQPCLLPMYIHVL